MPRLRVLLYGLGPIGVGIAGIVLQRGYDIVGAVDTDPAKSGRPLRELLPGAPADVAITSSAADVAAEAVDVVIHSTQSRLPQVMPQLLPLLEAGWSVLSTLRGTRLPLAAPPAGCRPARLCRADPRRESAGHRRESRIRHGPAPGHLDDAVPRGQRHHGDAGG
ncbi:MAG: hypothetical protein ACRDFT_00865 [bacterium]